MHDRLNKRQNQHKSSAFTIVELLIVIVIIAILAAITIVAYNGIQTRARASAASSALSQAKKKLELYKVDNSTYPTTGNLATAGISNSDTTYQYTSTNGTAYCITATNGTVSYYLDSTTQPTPTQGGCTDHTYQGGVQMTNLVTNGDFSQGTTGWSSPPAGSTYNLTNGILNISRTTGVLTASQSTSIISGHAYVHC